jgi:two-component system response regulator YesN
LKSNLIISENIRCIIVDDEDLVRERFRIGFPLAENGFEIIGEAEDGEEALELCKQLNPDIVITDIVMPRMDGLQLTEHLKALMPRVKVIILSNYQEFDFARKAVQLGAIGYLLKITSGHRELLDLLERARKEIELDREFLLEKIQERHRFQQSKPLLRKQFIMNVMDQMYATPESLRKEFTMLELHPLSYGFTIAYLEIDKFPELKQTFHSRDISLFKYVLMQMIEEVSSTHYNGNLFPWTEENSLCLWLHWDSAYQMEQAESQVFSLFQKINEFIKLYLPFTVTSGFSKTKRHSLDHGQLPTQLKEAVNEAISATTQRFYNNLGMVYTYFHFTPYHALGDAQKQALNNSLQSINPYVDDSSLRRSLYEEVISKIQEQHVQPAHLITWLEEITKHWTANDPLGATALINSLELVEVLQDVEAYLLRLMQWKRTIQVLSSKDNQYRIEIQDALDYINTHFHKPISVTDVCQHHQISPNYFSHLFKAQTGSNFSDYVTHYRMQAAKKLLKETTLQVQEISERVGIPDYKYFTRLFRRSTGQTPSAFREQSKIPLG